MRANVNALAPSWVELWTQRLLTGSLVALAFGLIAFGLTLYA